MSVTIVLTAPAGDYNNKLQASERSAILYAEGRVTVAGQVTPVLEVARVEMSVLASDALQGRMLGRQEADPTSIWRVTPTEAPSMFDMVGPLTPVAIDGAGSFSAAFRFVSGLNVISVVVTQTDGTKVMCQRHVQNEGGRISFPAQLRASEALTAAEKDWHLTPSVNGSDPLNDIPAAGSDGTIFYHD